MTEQLGRLGRHVAAVQAALAAVTLEPLRETAHAALIRAHLAGGNRWEALRQFRRCQDLLAAGLSVEPSEEIRQLITNSDVFSNSVLLADFSSWRVVLRLTPILGMARLADDVAAPPNRTGQGTRSCRTRVPGWRESSSHAGLAYWIGGHGHVRRLARPAPRQHLLLAARSKPSHTGSLRRGSAMTSAASRFKMTRERPQQRMRRTRAPSLTSRSRQREHRKPSLVGSATGRHRAQVVRDALVSPGRALPTSLRTGFEHMFAHDFSHVRIHTDGLAQQSARAVGAQAYTVANRVVFGQGAYAPDTGRGRKLIAHELTHVIQQGSGLLPSRSDPLRGSTTRGRPPRNARPIVQSSDVVRTALTQSASIQRR